MARKAATLVLLALLAGCTVGPDYHGAPVAAPRAAGGAGFMRGDEIPVASGPPSARWWESLGDSTLDALEIRALAANLDLARAKARIAQARASLREQRADLLPSASATALYAHARLPGLDLGSLSNEGDTTNANGSTTSTATGSGGSSTSSLNIYDAGFDATWEVDLFGGQRRAVQAARAVAEGAASDLADAQVSLTAQVGQAYVDLRDRQQRLVLSTQSIAMQEQMLALAKQRYARGTASRLDVARLSQQLDDTRADVTPLAAERDAYLDELATLTGAEPGALDRTMAAGLPIPLPPSRIAIGDPATLLQQRPDIRSAERTLAADTAKIGQADAARFPKLSFMGIIGIGGASASDLTHLDDFTALLAPQLSWSFLDFDRNLAKVRQAQSVRDEAEAKYRSTVLAALRDAEDSLSRFRYQRIRVATLARAKSFADEATTLARQRYQAGTTTLIDLLDTERQQVSTEQDLSASKAALTNDFIAIQKALGTGWSSTR